MRSSIKQETSEGMYISLVVRPVIKIGLTYWQLSQCWYQAGGKCRVMTYEDYRRPATTHRSW